MTGASRRWSVVSRQIRCSRKRENPRKADCDVDNPKSPVTCRRCRPPAYGLIHDLRGSSQIWGISCTIYYMINNVLFYPSSAHSQTIFLLLAIDVRDPSTSATSSMLTSTTTSTAGPYSCSTHAAGSSTLRRRASRSPAAGTRLARVLQVQPRLPITIRTRIQPQAKTEGRCWDGLERLPGLSSSWRAQGSA